MHVAFQLSSDQMTVSQRLSQQTYLNSGSDPLMSVSLGKKYLVKTHQLFSANS